MAQRTKNHIIEDESRVFFKKSLPEMWVYRDKTDDYGIDCEVEIFNDSGNSTGLIFWVQLKGTATRDDKIIKKVNFTKEKINQFANYNIPVLIVRFSSDKQIQFFKWAKSIIPNNKNTKNIGVQFYNSEIWNKATHESIKAYIENQNYIKGGLVKMPIKTFINRIENDKSEAIPYLNVSLIKQCLNTQKRYFDLTTNPKEAKLLIKIGDDFIITSFSDLGIATMSINFNDIDPSHIERLIKYILITFCQTLFDIGKNNIAEQIIFENNLLAIILRYKDYLISLLPHLLNGGISSKVLIELNGYFKNSNDNNTIAIATQIILLANKENNQISEETEQFLKTQLKIAKERKNNLAIARSLYNLGNFYRNRNILNSSLACFLEVRKYDNNYKKKPYYYYELAGVLFCLNKFYFSKLFYARSIELKTDYPYAKALLAHSYLYLGKYAIAQNKINEFLIEQKNNVIDIEEWQLWYSCLTTFLQNGYPKTQKRNEKLALKHIEDTQYKKSIEYDFLNALAWFNLGIMHTKEKDYLSGYFYFTFAGLLRNNDIEAWVNATVCGLNSDVDILLLTYTIRTAYQNNGYEYVNNLREVIKKQKPESLNIILEMVDEITQPRKKEPTIIRIYDDTGNYEKIVI